MAAARYHVLLNPRSGACLERGLTADALAESFAQLGMQANVDASDAPLDERVRAAAESEAEVIVAAGGDGTATALAQGLVGTSKAMAILPLGTANLLARDLNLPLDLNEALEALGAMVPRQIDVGEVNGRIFLHKVVIGAIPAIAAGREQLRGRHALVAKLGFARYVIHRLSRARRMAVAIASSEDSERIELVQSIAVANNAYDEGFGKVFARKRLDEGRLSLYLLRHLNVVDAVRLAIEMFAGRWQEDEALSIEKVETATIRTRRPTVSVMLDGEVQTMHTPLSFRIRPMALRVMAPPPEEVEVEAESKGAVAES